jgi:hypothetical protein
MTPLLRKRALAAGLGAALVLVPIVIGEISLALLLRAPSLGRRLPHSFLHKMRNLYLLRGRNLLQFDERFSRWDPELFYVLRPGLEYFESPEFSVELEGNRFGLRDSNRAVEAPEVVFLGDSVTMGWGVPVHKAFPRLVEKLTGLPTLNLGVASYGTVREMKLLDKIVKRAPRYLVVQYRSDDLAENWAYRLRKNTYVPRSHGQYEALSLLNAKNQAYYPGKYLDALFYPRAPFRNLLGIADVGSGWEDIPPDPPSEDEGTLFLNALRSAAKLDLKDTQIIVFSMKGLWAPRNDTFLASVDAAVERGKYPDHIRNMVLFDVSSLLRDEHFFTYDGHPNEKGHEELALTLGGLLQEKETQRSLAEKAKHAKETGKKRKR